MSRASRMSSRVERGTRGIPGATAACAGFALVYHLRAPWWRLAVGRSLMLMAGSLGRLCPYTVLIVMWPTGCTATLLRALRTRDGSGQHRGDGAAHPDGHSRPAR
ncbi:putative phage holin [Streptomyces goshikiensis]